MTLPGPSQRKRPKHGKPTQACCRPSGCGSCRQGVGEAAHVVAGAIHKAAGHGEPRGQRGGQEHAVGRQDLETQARESHRRGLAQEKGFGSPARKLPREHHRVSRCWRPEARGCGCSTSQVLRRSRHRCCIANAAPCSAIMTFAVCAEQLSQPRHHGPQGGAVVGFGMPTPSQTADGV